MTERQISVFLLSNEGTFLVLKIDMNHCDLELN